MRWCLCLFLLATALSAEDQIVLDVRFLSIPQPAWGTLGLESTGEVTPKTDDLELSLERANTESSESVIQLVSATSLTESRPPISHQILRPENMAQLIQVVQTDPRATTLLAPKMTTNSGETAHIRSTTKRPFVVDLRGDGEKPTPVVKEIEEGTILAMRPDFREDGALDLALQLQLLRLSDVKTSPKDRRHPDHQIQVPETTVMKLNLAARLQPGETLAIWSDSLNTIREGQATKRGLLGLGKPRVVAIARERIPLILFVTPTIIPVEDEVEVTQTSPGPAN